ncbi:MAG: helix-turn-helix domain-containing protein [Elainellaceae cyanobacterium]
MTIKAGSKYYPLFEHLQGCRPQKVTLTFAEIEALLGGPLPTSALHKKNWWSNRDSASALQAKAWINAGYQIEAVDLEQQTVTFGEFQTEYNIERADGAVIWRRDAVRALRKHMGLTQAKFAQELGVRRQTVSEWENGVYDPDRAMTKFLGLVAKQADFPALHEEG